MCDMLNTITQTVRVVVRRVDAPFTAGPVVRLELDAVGDRVLLAFL